MLFVAAYIGRLASKTTDVNWTKAKDLGDHMGYYKARLRTIPLSNIIQISTTISKIYHFFDQSRNVCNVFYWMGPA